MAVTGRLKGALTQDAVKVLTASGNYTLVNEAAFVANKTSGAATTVTLPKSPRKGRTVEIKDGKGDAGTNNITVNTSDSKTIDGATSYVIAVNYGGMKLRYNGTEWNVLSLFSSGGTNRTEAIAALTTAGAGSLTAAAIVGGIVNRTGATTAFTDTTVAASAIIAALPGATVGRVWNFVYDNYTPGAATLTGGSGVTVSGITVVPPGMWARFLVTYTATNTITIVGVEMGPLLAQPNSKYTTAALSSTTAAAGQLTGAATVYMNNSGANPGTYTTRIGSDMAADNPGIPIGYSYTLVLTNGQATGTLTLAAGASGVTITGTATLAGNVGRIYQVTYTALNTWVFQNIGSFTAP